MKKIIRMTGISIAAIFGLVVIIGIIFLNFSPQFGKGNNKVQKKEYSKLLNFRNGKFTNQHPSPMDVNYWKIFKELTKNAPNRNPTKSIQIEKIDSASNKSHDANITQLTWFGHSTILLEIDGKKILIDPILSKTPSPISFLGAKRYSNSIPIEAEELPFIDAVILSHDHYDHLDYKTIKQIKNKVGRFYTPLGVGNHLKYWGVIEEKITELNWWESVEFDSISLVCTPARHFSGRGLFDRATTLWCSWVIKGTKNNIYFSGDSGYDTHFKEIGDKYGPFDISLMECGQYNEDWKLLHMMPEETVKASVDLKSKLILPIHWGAFTLAFHDWTDPIERAIIKANELNIPITTPKIGEPVMIGDKIFPSDKWWLNYIKNNNN